VFVATPPDSHLDLTLRALEAGKDVIVEKPAFPRAAHVATVEAAAARAGRRVLVAENFAYLPLAAALRSIVGSGELGDVLFVQLNAIKRQRHHDWRDHPDIAGGGALYEGGVHWIDLLANLGLTVASVAGFHPREGGELERSMLVVVRYAEGAVGTLHHSWAVPVRLRGLRTSRVYGTGGSALFESNGLFVVVAGRRARLLLPGLRDLRGYGAMFADFFDGLATGREPRMTLERARRDLELVEAAYRSAGLSPPLSASAPAPAAGRGS
jgi:predicted dehydrogenase